MTAADVDAVLAVQVPGAVLGLADVFDQAAHPFPRDAVARRWREEVADPEVDCRVALADEVVVGFAATRGEELLHFGTAVDSWGTGLATWLHDEVLALLAAAGHERARLRVFTANGRGRRFYDKLGWQPTGEVSHSTFAPYPELLTLSRLLG